MARLRPKHVLITLAVVVLLLAIGVVFAVIRIRIEGPLAGPSRHDFGVVQFDTPPAEVEHTFRLVNRGDRPLALVNIKRSCNCASAVATPEVVEPGATLDVTVTMTLRNAAAKKSRITLVFDDGEGQVLRNLFVTAEGIGP